MPLPDFSPIPLPWAKVTPGCVATIDRLKAWADAPLWLTNLEVVARVTEIPRRISADGSSRWELRNDRTKWEIHRPEVTRQIVMLCLLERLNVRHDQHSAALMPALQDLMARADARVAAMTP